MKEILVELSVSKALSLSHLTGRTLKMYVGHIATALLFATVLSLAGCAESPQTTSSFDADYFEVVPEPEALTLSEAKKIIGLS